MSLWETMRYSGLAMLFIAVFVLVCYLVEGVG